MYSGLWPASVEMDENSSFSSLRKRERRERREGYWRPT
jgi:hypothetical protein